MGRYKKIKQFVLKVKDNENFVGYVLESNDECSQCLAHQGGCRLFKSGTAKYQQRHKQRRV